MELKTCLAWGWYVYLIMVKKISVWSLLILGLLGPPAHSRPPGFPFLKLGVGAAAQSMGGAYIAQARDASASYWNPSALAMLESAGFFFYHSQFISDFSYNYFSYARPFMHHNSAFGLTAARFSKGTFEGRDDNGQQTGDFSASDSLLGFSFGRKITKRASVGLGLNVIQSKIDSFSAGGVALDLTSTYQISARTRLAGGIYHLGPRMRYDSEPFDLPATLALGLSRQVISPLTITADMKYGIYDQKTDLSFGGEFNLAGAASFRMGYLSEIVRSQAKSDNPDLNRLSGLGMGIGLKLFTKGHLDYAFIPMGELGGTHHMSFSWRFR